MKHEATCSCVICTEWSGVVPPEWFEFVIPEEDYPDPFMEVLGG